MPSGLQYLGIPGNLIFIVAFALALASFIVPLHAKYRWIVTMGRPYPVGGSPAARLGNMLRQVFGATKILTTGRSRLPGVMHVWMFYGFIFMQLNNLEIFLEGVDPSLRLPFMSGPILVLIDLVYILVFTSCVVFALIRYVGRPRRLSTAPESLYVLLFIAGLVVTEFGTETLRLVLTGHGAPYAWLAGMVAPLFLHASPAGRQIWYDIFWWGHLVDLGAFMWFLPRSKHMHLLVAPFNLYLEPIKPKGQLPAVDLEDEKAESFGAAKLEDFTWKGLLDLLACIECGRCQDVCPAYAAGKPLSPKEIIVGLKHHLHAKGPVALRVAAGASAEDLGPRAAVLEQPLVGEVVSEEALWACTTCRACVQACPLGIDPMEKIVDMRRHLAMDVGEMPAGMAVAVSSIEERGHPWRGAAASRMDWAEGLDVPVLAPGEETDVLLWVGCTAALDARNRRVLRALVHLLRKADVPFAVLGDDETCTGDPARRMGNEYLFQMQAATNVQTLSARRFRRIVSTCPHCCNTLRNEYPDFGGHFTVTHHSEFLAELVREGRLPSVAGGPAGAQPATVTLHDPCYLGRYNGQFAGPRDVAAAAGGRLVEMRRSGTMSFCCGAGGGHAFTDEPADARVNILRARQARDTGASVLATACPFCLIMMEDGVKATGTERDAPAGAPGEAAGGMQVRDVAEILADAILGPEGGRDAGEAAGQAQP